MCEFYRTYEVLLSPELRAAFLRAFTGLEGLETGEVVVDDRNLVAIRHTERGNTSDVLFDPMTGRAVGTRSLSWSDSLKLITLPGEPAPDPRPGCHLPVHLDAGGRGRGGGDQLSYRFRPG